MRILTSLAFVLAATLPSQADILFTFNEGAPKDRFTIENQGNCDLTDAVVTLDLGKSQAGLVFDVTDRGAGVQVYQPFKFTGGQELVQKVSNVADGDNLIDFSIQNFPVSSSVSFTIDVDDTLGGREITVNGAEIQGAEVRVEAGGKTYRSTFDASAQAVLPVCLQSS